MKRVNFDCTYNECQKPAFCRQLCKVHYELWLRHVNPAWAKKHNEKGKKHRKKYGDLWRKKHSEHMRKSRRTKTGYLRHKHSMMRTRVLYGRKYWKGKPICDRADFLRWSLQNPSFHRVFNQWLKNQDNPSLWPSIDRIDPSLGYVIGNMRWITHAENHR